MRASREWEPPVRTEEEHDFWSATDRLGVAERRSFNQALVSLGRAAEVMPIPEPPINPREYPCQVDARFSRSDLPRSAPRDASASVLVLARLNHP